VIIIGVNTDLSHEKFPNRKALYRFFLINFACKLFKMKNIGNYKYNNRENSDAIQNIVALCENIVLKYVSRNAIPYREKEDVIMAVTEKFMNQKDKIDNNFKGKSKVSTYYISVLNRMCCEIIRKEQKHWFAVQDLETKDFPGNQEQTQSFDTEKELIIKEELKRLKKILQMYTDEHFKLLIFLNYFYRIPVKAIDIEQYNKEHFPQIRRILTETPSLSKGEIFENLAKVVSISEKKHIGADALRMWLNKAMTGIINRMNINGIYQYNKETLGILLEMLAE
jgi:DNA-directed RNA polymerase specialized sigma24 family protein